MIELTAAEVQTISGGIPAYITGSIMEKCGFSLETTLAVSAMVDATALYASYPALSLMFPIYVFSAYHLIPAALFGAALGYLGFLSSQANPEFIHC